MSKIEMLAAVSAIGIIGLASSAEAFSIINRDAATATDIEELIEYVRQTVLDTHGVELQHEVRIVGEMPA